MSHPVQDNEHRLSVYGSKVNAILRPGATILETLLEQGVEYPHGCTTGFCGLCKSHLLSGQVEHLDYLDSALSEEERRVGLILPCCAIPTSDCLIEPAVSDVPLPAVVSLDTEIVKIELVTPDVWLVQLRSPEPFEFLAGQYASLTFDGLPAREFSMASEPGNLVIDFYIKRVLGGAVTDEGVARAVVGGRVTINGPYGTAFLRSDDTSPIVAVGGGTGIAPILSMLLNGLGKGINQDIRLYFGVRNEPDLFSVNQLEDLASAHKNLSLNVVLSAPGAQSARWRRGRLDAVLKADLASQAMSSWRAYIAGSPTMVNAVDTTLAAMGVPSSRRHCDPFLTTAERDPSQRPGESTCRANSFYLPARA
ncbi:2Fe-2S iron-sulfur cluster-binding protein [Bradyrhizobium sp. CW1]|uniref:2Fe-2S iron-sulfur cluster-binding protein n=1 Tax=Bradyrhizobium sp. CW1 TaxID=2782686 RepID=UPI001FFF60A8|nr:2Fe-2S iron-sulfur cluster-binding protein [Bradyrhizobium sp. CW1]UPJ26387.1 2Fe-2S iron-sulfur cluster binding domain-containing protein [Bradyrhizobium sp. CW1]